MQNKKPKYTNSAYNNMLSNLTSDVYLVKSKAKNELFKNIDKDKWVETSNKKINLKQAIDLLLEYKDHPEYQYKNQVYKYDGTIEFKKNECNSVRKLIQIEARILKDIFYHAENMFNHLKEFNLEAVKYKKLYKLKIEQNFYHKELLELKDKLKTIRDEWDGLTETYSYPNDDYCELDNYSEEKQDEMRIKFDTDEKVLQEQIINMNNKIKKIDKEITDFKIEESDIANTFYI